MKGKQLEVHPRRKETRKPEVLLPAALAKRRGSAFSTSLAR